MRYQYKANKNGFTLIELAVVLIIISIAASLVVVSINKASEKAAFKSEVKRVYNLLKQAKDRAVIEKAVFTFMVDEEKQSVWLQKDEGPQGPGHVMPPGITIKAGPVVFFPKGDSTGGQIEIKGPRGRKYLIEVSAITGIAKIKGPVS